MWVERYRVGKPLMRMGNSGKLFQKEYRERNLFHIMFEYLFV